MKNAVIVVLVIALAIMGIVLVTNKTVPNTSISQPQSSTADTSAKTGKTINLANKGLREVPKNILDDSTVTVFDVSGNNLTGALPAEIRKLTNLEVLNASHNNMTGIPAEIGQLSKLKTVNFANNNLSGLPLEIGNLKNLETLDLRGNPNISRHDIGLIQPKIPNAKILTD